MDYTKLIKANKLRISIVIILIGIFTSIAGNSLFVLSGSFLLVIIFQNLYKINLPNVLLLIAIYYWLQIFAAVFQKNVLEQQLSLYPALEKAIFLSSLGLFAIVIVFGKQLKKIKIPTNEEITFFSSKFSDFKLFAAFLIYLLFNSFIISYLKNLVPALNQFFISLNFISWLLYSLLFFKCFYADGSKLYIWLATCLSFFVGFYSYFSNFKEVLFYLFILGTSLPYLLKIKHFILIIGVIFFVFQLAVTWTAIKSEYRNYLSGGERVQQVIVNRDDAMTKLYSLWTNIDRDRYVKAYEALWDRIQYQRLFSVVLERVPAILPYEGGNLWLSNLSFVFTPRFLNPFKGVLDPSSKTTKYSGIVFANVSMGTSISLGYFVECYIDFGEVGMMFPIILIAFIISRSFRYFASEVDQNVVVRYALAIAALGPFYVMESDGITLIGRLFFNITTYYFLEKFLLKPLLKLLEKNQAKNILN